MIAHIILDMEDGSGSVLMNTEIIDERETLEPRDAARVGEHIGDRIGGYLRAKREWQRKSPIERMLLQAHDTRTGYKGVARAGQIEGAWGFEMVDRSAIGSTVATKTTSRQYNARERQIALDMINEKIKGGAK